MERPFGLEINDNYGNTLLINSNDAVEFEQGIISDNNIYSEAVCVEIVDYKGKAMMTTLTLEQIKQVYEQLGTAIEVLDKN